MTGTRTKAVAGSALFFVAAPCVMGGLLPWLIGHWQFHPMWTGGRIMGGVLIAFGLPGLVDSFARFALQGLGTPAPVAPTRSLVVTGLYRYVRNPMYVTVAAIVFGQALLFGDPWIALYGATFWLVTHLFVVLYEEPTLHRQFGERFTSYRTAVPRWIPRLTPWSGA